MKSNDKSPYDILYEDEDVIIVYKKRNVFSVSTADKATFTHNLFQYLQWYANRKKEKVLAVHRLDYETSGVMAFAKKPEVKEKLQRAFEERKVGRYYEAVIKEKVPLGREAVVKQYIEEKGTKVFLSDPLNGKEAITSIRVQNYIQIGTVLAIKIETGRRSQIRFALEEEGYTLLGDKRIAHSEAKRMYLNEYKLTFPPETGLKKLEFETIPLWLAKTEEKAAQ